ncbi:DUF305 domain-containing protein [Glutamicibacter nicotianae]|uniref:DUF305 domain-containing protein n=1 Tax=Glutamicibacter nicotianae TaxID=37929 RepID=A0ABQ0RMR5_GLUNI|nr:DUF305 domain-containing protein [Glutamicibacter nicotianae]KWR70559.1 DUF305 domain-containing protein [Arthrobacter sp. W1]GEC13116.1 DUF305 domain-containing protein [Glutamicibacter nicotianae]
MKRLTSISATALAAALVLSGCSPDAGTTEPESTMSGMDHGSMPPSASDAAADHNSADAMFAQMMTPHHEQAVQMSDIMLAKKNLDPRVTELAQDIKAAQGPEIKKMNDWLQTWGEPMKMSGSHEMDGMMTPEDLSNLEAAQGTEASRLFLTQMIAHHEGAITMAEDEVANGSNPAAVELAKDVVSSQGTEIQAMKALLADL